MLKPTPWRLAAVASLTTVALLGTACGSSDDDSSGDAPSAQENAAVEESSANVEELANPAEYAVEPLSGEVPEGKVVAQVNCTIPQCTPGAMEEPVEALGWTLERFDYDLTKGTPDYLRAVDAALDSSPDYLALNFFGSPDLVARQLERAKAEGIPVIGAGVEIVDNVALMVQSPKALNAIGAHMADVAVDDAGGPVNVAIPVDPTSGPLTAQAAGVEDRLAEVEGSSAERIEVSFSQPQPTNVSTIINHLKANPDTEYLMFPGTAFYPGIDQGLAAAGLTDRVKLIMAFPFPSDLKTIQDGRWLGVVAAETSYQWRQVDGMARLAAGESIEDKTPTNESRLLTPENVSVEGFDPPGYKEAFKSAWGV